MQPGLLDKLVKMPCDMDKVNRLGEKCEEVSNKIIETLEQEPAQEKRAIDFSI